MSRAGFVVALMEKRVYGDDCAYAEPMKKNKLAIAVITLSVVVVALLLASFGYVVYGFIHAKADNTTVVNGKTVTNKSINCATITNPKSPDYLLCHDMNSTK